MNKKLLCGLVILSAVFGLSAASWGFTDKYFEARIGTMYPWAVNSLGFRGGAMLGYRVDQIISVNGYLDYFRASGTQDFNTATNGTINVSTSKVTSEFGANMLMFMVNIRGEYPDYFAERFKPYAQVGVGYEIMFNTYNNAADKTKNQFNVYFGDFLAFHFDAGTQFKLGDESYLYGQIGYNLCTMRGTAGANDTVSLGNKVDVGGISAIFGIGFRI